ncbi:hypothetical protein E4634_03625 [Mangrovimicrobium sediminis]|uniref:Uncharacterized protein n=1 Tax=Mangrovimicrobium sediminis TaxID=2562682 RepID=A0A4Z0M6S6_9GAMM|nr:hypothetical protein [Haliea sp. SAOS-164]TGD75110.1 hypothetical protein E4634_03625 [Haliea sp. SAOS-164]
MPQKKQRTRAKRAATKDRVLQARIPTQLDDQLRGRAEQLGLSVSTVVRNVLLNTFDLVEDVVSDSARLGMTLCAPGSQPAVGSSADASPGPAVIAWQEATLNLNGVCEQCNTLLPRGERAAIGLPVQARPVLLCLACLAALSAGTPEPGKVPSE